MVDNSTLECLRGLGAIVVRSPLDGSCLVMERYGRSYCRIGEDDENGQAQAERFLESIERAREFVPRFGLFLTVCEADVHSDAITRALGALARAAVDAERVQLRVVCDPCSGGDWWGRLAPFLQRHVSAIQSVLNEKRVAVVVETARLGQPPERVIQRIVQAGMAIKMTCTDPPTRRDDRRLDDLRYCCRHGLRVPVVYYVKDGAAAGINGVVADVNQAAQYSGFGLRPIQCHPNYDVERMGELVSPEEFVGLVSDVYVEFPYYDDVLEPVCHASEIMDPRNPLKRAINVIVNGDGNAYLYRTHPRRGIQLLPRVGLDQVTVEQLRDEIGRVSGAMTSAAKACSPCGWACLCPGTEGDPQGDACYETACNIWQHLLTLVSLERDRPANLSITHNSHGGSAGPIE